MQSNWFRTILIYAVLVIAAINIYPTLSWMMKSEEQRQQVVDTIREDELTARMDNYTLFQRLGMDLRHWTMGDPDRIITLGLDLQGGLHVVADFDMNDDVVERGLDESMVQDIILETIRNRTNEFGVQEPIIRKQGTNQVQVQLPGVKDLQRALDLIFSVGELGFHIVSGSEETQNVLINADRVTENRLIPFLAAPEMPGGPFRIPIENYEYIVGTGTGDDKIPGILDEIEKIEGVIPDGKKLAISRPPQPWETDQSYELYLMDIEASVTGDGLKSAVARPDDASPGQWKILFEFNADAATQFATLTENNIGRDLGIVLDGNVVSAPTIRGRISNSGEISGSFTPDESKDLAIALNSGALPVTPYPAYSAIVDASLGADSVSRGSYSSLVGLLLVMAFMVVYYRVGGIVANIGLAANALMLLGAFAYFDVTLTLPGIAGLILTIGMAVDANVLIFERIREELRAGKSVANSVTAGFDRATMTILDANVTTLIAAVVLLQFGTGPVQGFALALSIGICTSVFAALVVSRACFDFMLNRKMLQKMAMLSILKGETSIGFLSRRKIAATVSAVIIAIGIIMVGVRGESMLGVDFTNGTSMVVQLNQDEEIEVGSVRAVLETAGFDSPIVQVYTEAGDESKNNFLIKVPVDSGTTASAATDEGGERDNAETVSIRVQEVLAPLVSDGAPASDSVTIKRSETVGAAVGAKLQRDAGLAIGYALIFIVFYLWFRFELKFAAGAVLALVHDVAVVTGLFALAGREISIPVVAALLTIIGYSLNDTIVVFDRVREDLGIFKARNKSFLEILDISINRTLGRTLLTSLTTFFVVGVLFIFGGNAINDFAFALMAGVVVGTYSSIFVATPAVYFLDQRRSAAAEAAAEKGKGGKNKKKGKS